MKKKSVGIIVKKTTTSKQHKMGHKKVLIVRGSQHV